MKLLEITYHREFDQDDGEQAGRLLAAAERIAGLPGLLWKIWIYDDERETAGGVYLFDGEANAHAWGDHGAPTALAHLPGVSGVEARYFDVDERLTAITRGPLATAGRV